MPVIPALFGYAVSPLPMVWQLTAYHAFAVIVAVALWRELEKLFGATQEASLLAVALIAGLFAVDPTLLTNLSWVPWSALLAAVVHLLRATTMAAPIGWWAMMAIAAGLLTAPAGVVAVPLLIAHALRVGPRRLLSAGLAAVVVAAHSIQAWWYPSWDVSPRSSLAVLLDGLSGEWREHAWFMVVSLALLTALAIESVWRPAKPREAMWLLVVATAATVMVIVSGRVAEQGFEGRYVPRALVLRADRGRTAWARIVTAGAAFCGWAVLRGDAAARRAHVERRSTGPVDGYWQRYQFVAAGAELRRQFLSRRDDGLRG